MGDTFNSGGGTQIIVKGKGAIGQINYAPTAELLALLGQVQQELSRLPLSETDKGQVKNAVKTAQKEARKKEPDAAVIAAKLTTAQKVLAAVSGTVVAAQPVLDLLGKALIWCGKAMGM